MLQQVSYRLTGECPILFHSAQTADPLNRYAKMIKQISSKKKKTDADFEQMAKIEWYASVYLDKGKVCLPSEVLEAAFVSGARKHKVGKDCQAGMFVVRNAMLEFDGDDLSIDELWERDQNRFTVGVRIQRSRVMRTRFRVDQWSALVEIAYDDEIFNLSQVDDIVRVTGSQCGLCDWRPKFGRYLAECV